LHLLFAKLADILGSPFLVMTSLSINLSTQLKRMLDKEGTKLEDFSLTYFFICLLASQRT